MENIIQRLQKRLQAPLPFAHIENEDIDENLKKFIIQAFQNPPKPPRICAVMIVLFKENGVIKMPFIVRPQTNRVHPGQIAFPGGGREEQDEDLEATAIRETFEEIGVIIPKSQIIGRLSDMYVVPSNSLITPVVAFLKEKQAYQPDPKEADRVLEVALDDILNVENQTVKVISTPHGTVKMPAFRIGGELIWGATARILRELVMVLEG